METMDRYDVGRMSGREVDRELCELIGEHVVRYVAQPVGRVPDGDIVVDPQGMTLAEEAELECLLAMADARRDGDEQAAIDRLITALEEARNRAGAP